MGLTNEIRNSTFRALYTNMVRHAGHLSRV